MSYVRYPLNRILASEGAVRVLRELCRSGDVLGVPSLAQLTHLHPETVRAAMGDLVMLGMVEALGINRGHLYRISTTHPLYAPLSQLFEAEEARVQSVMETLRSGARSTVPDALAVWLYGSVARGQDTPGSDLDVALVISGGNVDSAMDTYRAAIASVMEQQGVSVSVVGLSDADVVRLADEDAPWWRNVSADAQPLLGLPPEALASHLRAVRTQAA